MEAFVLPRAPGAGPDDRVDGGGEPGKRAAVVAHFQHAGAWWEVDGDTRFEPLWLAWNARNSDRERETFRIRDTGKSWALALRPDLYAALTISGDRGAGKLFVRARKAGPKPTLEVAPPLRAGGGITGARRRGETPVAFDPLAISHAVEPGASGDPERTAVLVEKANEGHHQILVRLFDRLNSSGWTEIGQFPDSIDLWARSASGDRVIFEAKTISDANSVAQCRRGLAQLLEYRLEVRADGDGICLVTDTPLPPRRASILERLGVAVLAITPEKVLVPGGERGVQVAAALEPPEAAGRKDHPRAQGINS